jgi:hypothetical protein
MLAVGFGELIRDTGLLNAPGILFVDLAFSHHPGEVAVINCQALEFGTFAQKVDPAISYMRMGHEISMGVGRENRQRYRRRCSVLFLGLLLLLLCYTPVQSEYSSIGLLKHLLQSIYEIKRGCDGGQGGCSALGKHMPPVRAHRPGGCARGLTRFAYASHTIADDGQTTGLVGEEIIFVPFRMPLIRTGRLRECERR